jgi:hypothetical protein
MAFQSAPNMAEAVISGILAGEEVLLTPNFVFGGSAYAQLDIDALAEAVDDWYSFEILPLLSVQYLYVETRVRGLTSAVDLYGENGGGTGAGGVGTAAVPNNVAFAVKHTTGFTGRSARGRTFMTGFAQASLQAGDQTQLQAVYVTNLLAAWDTLETYLGSTGWAQIVLSRRTLGALRPVAVAYIVTAHSVTDFQVDTQKRRLP